MVDFKRLGRDASAKPPRSLLETFNRLDRQVSHVELRPSQIRILGLIDAQIGRRDLVVKLNTGGGKTTIGLLYLKHKLDELRQPVVYLVPTVQLAEQVIEEGRRIGFPVEHWASRQPYPPQDALAARAAIVCTYDKFFNGISTFARSDVKLIPGAIVLDDVHAGIEAIRKDFACFLPEGARREIVELLKADLNAVNPSQWAGISTGSSRALLEVPHWIFAQRIDAIRNILERSAAEEEMVFAWRHISPLLENARLILSGDSAYIALDPPALERVPHYAGAAHRLFMSASVHDGAALIRELGCAPDSAASPIEIGAEASVGERMIIVPTLIAPEFSRSELQQVATAVRGYANVVVLVSAYADAASWAEIGATVATNETIAREISNLKAKPSGNMVVFVQRYDGIDLPDSACRLLIIDGLPKGETPLDRLDLQLLGGVVGMRNKVANRVEQGLGRAVRSASDYCAVVLAGQDIAGFVARSAVLESFSPQTVRQIEIGRTVSEAIKDSPMRVSSTVETIMQCLRRDSDWKNFYVDEMSEETQAVDRILANAEKGRSIASHERSGAQKASSRDYTSATRELKSAASLAGTDHDLHGVLKQSAAKHLFHIDQVAAMQLQSAAYAENYRVSKPPILLPADTRRITSQAEVIANWISGFAEINGALIEVDEIRAKLSFTNDSKDVEEAVRRLGALVGAVSSRPDCDQGRGPDNLWMFGECAFVIEIKSGRSNVLYKDDAEQLQSSLLWVADRFGDQRTLYPLIGSNAVCAEDVRDFAFDAKLWTEFDFVTVADRVRRLTAALIEKGPSAASDASIVQRYLGPSELLPSQLLQLSRTIKQKR